MLHTCLSFPRWTFALFVTSLIALSFENTEAQTEPIPRAVKIVVSPYLDLNEYVIHTRGGYAESLTPLEGTATDEDTGIAYSGYMVSAILNMGDYFWLTRAADGAFSPEDRVRRKNLVVNQSASFPRIPNRETQLFRIGQERFDHDLRVLYVDGSDIPLSWIADGNSRTWDDNGQPVDYSYADFTGWIEEAAGWTLVDETTNEDLGRVTTVLEGWHPLRPDPPSGFLSLLMNRIRSGHILRLKQDTGPVWNVSRAAGYQSPDVFLPLTKTFFEGQPAERTYTFEYFPAVAPYDYYEGFTVKDLTVGDEISFQANSSSIDLSLWYPPKTALALTVSATRWQHDLWLQQANGDSVPLEKGGLQGIWSSDAQGRVWFSSYGYFGASAEYHPELDWWIFDATSNEVSSVNPADLETWMGNNTDSDGDTLPDWYEAIVGTDSSLADSDSDGIPDAWEMTHDSNPRDSNDANLPSSAYPNLTNIRVYERDERFAYLIQLPLGRASHGFRFHYWDNDLGMESTVPASTVALMPAGWEESAPNLPANSYIGVRFDVCPTRFSQWWLSDDTTGELSQANTFDLRQSFSAQATGVQSFAIPASRLQHSFAVVMDNGNTYPLTRGGVLGEDAPNQNGSGTEFRSYGFFTALAYLDGSGGSFRLVDLASGQQAPENSTELVTAGWSPISLPWLVRSVSMWVSSLNPNVGSSFTFHTSSGSLQGMSASTVWDSATQRSRYMVSASVGVGESFWLTRDYGEPASSPQQQMLLDDQVLDWSQYFPPGRSLQTDTFQIGGNRSGHSFAVHHPDGFVSNLWNLGGGYLTTWDDNGQSVTYNYDNYQGEVDISQQTLGNWSLYDETTGENLGSTTSVLEGWQPWHPNAPAGSLSLMINSVRSGHLLTLRQDDDTMWKVRRATGYESTDASLSTWNTVVFSGTMDQSNYEFRYFPATAPFDPSQGFTVRDEVLGDERYLPAGTTSADLSLWYPPASPLTVKISSTRWTHELWLHASNGESFGLLKGNLQGLWASDNHGRTWFSSYGWFDAATSYHPEIHWWIFDATTGEAAPADQLDLSSWPGDNSDSDGDRLPDWYEFIVGTDRYNADSDWDGMTDDWEIAHNLNPNDPSDANAPAGDAPFTNLRAWQRDQTETYSIMLPLGRATHGFTFNYWDDELGVWGSVTSSGGALEPQGWFDESGYHLAEGSYWNVNFQVCPARFSQWWLSDNTNAENSEPDLFDLRPFFTVPQVPCFAIPSNRASHSFAVVTSNGNSYPVSHGGTLGEDVPSGGGSAFRPYGFFNAMAYPDYSGDFYLIDLTSNEQAPANATELLNVTWSPISLPWVMRSVTIVVSTSNPNIGDGFTFHTSSGSLQGVVQSNPTDAIYSVSGSVGVGETFWLTRGDGTSSPQQQMLMEDQVVDWSSSFPPIRSVQTYSFQVGSNRQGHALSVRHSDGFETDLTESGNGYLTTWDDDGQPVNYSYQSYSGGVDINLPGWLLHDKNTGEDLGEVPSVFEGWEPWHPNPPAGFVPLIISRARSGHTLRLRQDDDTLWKVNRAVGYESPDSFLSTWKTVYPMTPDEHSYELQYFPATAAFDPSQGFWVEDETLGDRTYFPPGTISAELSAWYPPSTTRVVTGLSATRWQHELWLAQPNGDSFHLANGNLQGLWTSDAQGRTWFTNYGHFDAATEYHPELEWWIYDATTNEVSPSNGVGLTAWASDNTDSDGDGLADWYEFILGTDRNLVDSDGDGVWDNAELLLGRNPSNGQAVVSGTLNLEVFTPLE
jgi:hypothetical protein